MRRTAAMALWLACLVGLFACSHAKPPAGRWEGTYDAADVMVAVRLEIDGSGNVFLSAPDAIDFPAVSDEQRQAMHARLARHLTEAWGEVTPRHFEFDGSTFRNPGGFAPQMEWNAADHQMTAIVYLERRSGIRIPLHAVSSFSANPWPA
ncbi:MAG TPA: hypothetical protein VHY56_02685 [Candidatus Binataceae bacterium]|jgi:hypothetical protein|nr:hypothetical protein [Candidatus Binataceae bacterium]